MAVCLTRSRSRQQSQIRDDVAPSRDTTSRPTLALRDQSQIQDVELLPDPLSRSQLSLKSKDFQLLQLKQQKLRDPKGQIHLFILQRGPAISIEKSNTESRFNPVAQAAAATLVFAQEEAGTAICISPTGLLLTCSHFIAESREEFDRREDKWLLFSSRQVVRAKGVTWHDKQDLALLQVVAAQAAAGPPAQDTSALEFTPDEPFPFISIAETNPISKTPIFCIGHPGSEDLETSTAGIATGYDVLHVSSGHFRGVATDQDPEDNSEIGALMHDAWTYWGHSGAPLIERKTGRLIGLHSSWDENTGMRRGVPLGTILAFLDECVVTEGPW